MKNYKGYKVIKDKIHGYKIPGCVWFFPTIKHIKYYVDDNPHIRPTNTGSMLYID